MQRRLDSARAVKASAYTAVPEGARRRPLQANLPPTFKHQELSLGLQALKRRQVQANLVIRTQNFAIGLSVPALISTTRRGKPLIFTGLACAGHFRRALCNSLAPPRAAGGSKLRHCVPKPSLALH